MGEGEIGAHTSGDLGALETVAAGRESASFGLVLRGSILKV